MNEMDDILKFPPKEKQFAYPGILSAHNILLSEDRGNLKILDIGGGKAKNRSLFTALGHEYICLDIVEELADIVADMHSLPFEDASFDAVISTSALQYAIDLNTVFTEVRRVLKESGTFTGSIAFLEPWTWNANNQPSPSGLYELLCRHEFEIQYIWPGWTVFDALKAAFQKNDSDESQMILALKMASNAFNNLSKEEPTLLWEFAGSLNFHAIKQW